MRRPHRLTALTSALLLAAPTAALALAPGEVLYSTSQPGSLYGWAVSELTDVDGDGVTDWVAGAIGTNGNAGSTHVVSGASGTELFRWDGGGPWEYEGFSVADVGDVDGDGVHDVASGAVVVDRVTIHSGADGSLLLTHQGPPGSATGFAVGDAGDVDGDGHADVLVGAAFEGPGVVRVLSGADGSVLRVYEGAEDGDQFGSGLDGVGDVDGDGVADHVVGARDAGKGDGGLVYVFSGADGSLVHELRGRGTAGELGSFFVAGLDDVDGDGVADVYGGDYDDDRGGRGHHREDPDEPEPKADPDKVDSGLAYVWSGATGKRIHVLRPFDRGEGLGPGRGAGDVDGDGHEDLVVGSYTSDTGGEEAGRVTVFSGRTGKVLRTLVNDVPGEQLGFDAVGLGDVDGDGLPDLLVSAANGSRVYVVAGTE